MSVRRTPNLKESNPGLRHCITHQDRIATHQLLNTADTSQFFYCEKCSIKFASQGFTVLKLNPTPQRRDSSLSSQGRPKKLDVKQLRKAEVGRFMCQLESAMQALERKGYELQEYLIGSEQKFGEALQAVNEYFTHILELVQFEKYTAYNAILTLRSASEAKARFLRSNLNDQIEDVETMLRDIHLNMDAVESVEQKVYSDIMNGYIGRLSVIDEMKVEVSDLEQVEKLFVQLPEVPKNLTGLASKVVIRTQKSSSIATNLNSQVYKVVTEEAENQQSSYLSSPHRGKMTKSNPKSRKPLHNFSNTPQIGFSFEESAVHSKDPGTPELMEDFENSMLQCNLTQRGGRKNYVQARDSCSSFSAYRRDQSSISEADTLLIP